MGVYKEIIARFPRGNLSCVFAYGSGVKQQIGYEAVAKQKNNVIDLLFCVRDTVGWHAENMLRHPDHYSALRYLGPRFLTKYQERLGASVYCNTLVPLTDIGVTVKYGVVSREDLLDDLNNWKHLYLAGRLHKPVTFIVSPSHDESLSKALDHNLIKAFQVALLLLPDYFTASQLFEAICGLSYRGDFRMIFGENKNKVQNIVQAQLEEFLELYKPAMQHFSDFIAVDFNAKEKGTNRNIIVFEQEKSPAANEHHLRQLPLQLQERLKRNAAFSGSYADIIEPLAISSELHKTVQVSVNDIVWRSSITQSLKNIPSAGLLKSIVYSYRKAMKTFSV